MASANFRSLFGERTRLACCGGRPRPALPTTAALLPSALLILALATGCTHHAARRQKANDRLAEESRALTTAVVDILQNQPAANRDPYVSTALTFAKQDQRVEGLPLEPFDVPALLLGFASTNQNTPLPPATQAARAEVTERFAKQNALLVTQDRAESKLLHLGAAAETVRNERIARWTKFSLAATTLIGGAVALFIFFPLALPIAGRLLGWLVGKLPGLASALGVVSVKAFDALVRAVEKTKTQPPAAAPTVPVANTQFAPGDSRRGQAENFIDRLHNQLSREMDAAHKALVRARKTNLA